MGSAVWSGAVVSLIVVGCSLPDAPHVLDADAAAHADGGADAGADAGGARAQGTGGAETHDAGGADMADAGSGGKPGTGGAEGDAGPDDAGDGGGSRCAPLYVLSGDSCIPEGVYISPGGLDTNAGTQFSPFKTFDKAASVAVSGQTIFAATGTYGGDDFANPIPVGVTVDHLPSAVVTFNPSVSRTLAFAGDGALNNVSLKGFYSAFAASSGTQTLTHVSVQGQLSGITVTGTAKMTLNDVGIGSDFATEDTGVINVDSNASLTLDHSAVERTGIKCEPNAAGTASTILVTGAGSLSLVNATVTGIVGFGVGFESSGTLSITDSTVNACGFSVAFDATPGKKAVIRGSTFDHAIVSFGPVDLLVRSSTFTGMYGVAVGDPATGGKFDLGLATDPGGNHFEGTTDTAVQVSADSVTVNASGNTWVPSEQGADAQGHYTTGTTLSTTGRNVAVSGAGSVVRF